MTAAIRVRPAMLSDLDDAGGLHAQRTGLTDCAEQVRDGCVLLAESDGRLSACALVDLDAGELQLPDLGSGRASADSLRQLVTAAERLAARFAVFELGCDATGRTGALLGALGYRDDPQVRPKAARTRLKRRFGQRQSAYGRRIAGLLVQLGIAADYARTRRMPLQPEARTLVVIGTDIYGREQRLLPAAARAWRKMEQAARAEGVELQVVSAFRPVQYQAGIVERKLAAGQDINDILRVSAAPGYSEHHSGRALDLGSPGYAVLEEEFECSPAFIWLRAAASRYGFYLSFPRGNRHGVAYEPWHWAWRG